MATNNESETKGCPHSNCPVLREYRKAADMGPSVFITIRDTLCLDPKYKPHRNVDAVRVARLMSRMIKNRLCKRAMNAEGRLTWRFNDMETFDMAIDMLQEENKCLFLRDYTRGAAHL